MAGALERTRDNQYHLYDVEGLGGEVTKVAKVRCSFASVATPLCPGTTTSKMCRALTVWLPPELPMVSALLCAARHSRRHVGVCIMLHLTLQDSP